MKTELEYSLFLNQVYMICFGRKSTSVTASGDSLL